MAEYFPPTPHAAVSHYFDGLSNKEWASVRADHAQLMQNANPAFEAGYTRQILVPSLVSEEGGTVQTLKMLAENNQNEAIIVNANTPKRVAKSRLVRSRIEEIRQFVGDTKDVPMSFITKSYSPGTAIGGVMRDTYAAGMAGAVTLYGKSLPNIPMTRCDVDLVHMPSDYRPTIYERWDAMEGPSRLLAPRVLDDLVPQFPFLNRLVQWNNLDTKLGFFITPGHFTVDIHGYAGSGGQQADCAVAETVQLTSDMEDVFGGLQDDILPQYITVSPRNLLASMAHNTGPYYGKLTTPDGKRPTYRTEQVQEDITEAHYADVSIGIIGRCARRGFRSHMYITRGSGASIEERANRAFNTVLAIGATAVQKFGDSPASLDIFEIGLGIERAPYLASAPQMS